MTITMQPLTQADLSPMEVDSTQLATYHTGLHAVSSGSFVVFGLVYRLLTGINLSFSGALEGTYPLFSQDS